MAQTTLDRLEVQSWASIVQVGGEGALRQHFLDMGVIPGAVIQLVKFAPLGDPIEFKIHGYELTLRKADAARIQVETLETGDIERHSSVFDPIEPLQEIEHPGLGEGGRYHDKDDENPLPSGKVISFALAGNQNCGKTTLFNQLTGANQHVGNFPGVTVDRKNGPIKGHAGTDVVDLPGIYSLSPYTSEEIVSRHFLLEDRPDGIINIVDATNIERNLYLTMQLMELDVPMVLALNMMDELQGNGGHIRVNEMEEVLGVPVVPIAAVRNEGVDELVNHALHVARYQEKPRRQDFCNKDDNGGAVHRCLHAVMHLVEDHAAAADIPLRFAATKVVEGDEHVIRALNLHQNDLDAIEHIVEQMEQERGLDRAAAIADMRFSFIARVVSRSVVKPRESREKKRSNLIDRILTGTYTAIPAFIGVMALIFFLTFNVIGPWLQDLVAAGIDWLAGVTEEAMVAAQVNEVLQSLVIGGIFNGVGAVISFLPIILVLFFFLCLLEDTGYMARVAFVMDKLLRRIGLSGRSIVPLVMGFGCSVPAIMAARTLPSERDRKLTILLTPFMSCATKITIYGFFTAAFFPGQGGLIMTCLYLLGILVGIVTALVMRRTVFKGDAAPFVMELPNYRMPSVKSLGRLVWDKMSDFLSRAFTVIFVATIIVWFLSSFDLSLTMVEEGSDSSILALLAGWMAPLFAPLGFGDWRIVTSLIAGFMAKETVVSTLSVLFGSTAALLAAITPLAAMSLLVFCLLYTPCVAAIACVNRELGAKWALAVVVFQCAVAWVCAFIVHAIGLLLGFA